MGNTFFNRRLEKSGESVAAGVHSGYVEGEEDRSTPPAESPLDPQALDNLRHLQHAGDPDVLRQVVEAFLESCPPLLDTLRATIARRESLEAVHIAAHTFKSSCAMVGAVNLARLCRELEVMDGDEPWSALRRILDEIEDVYPPVCRKLMQECEKDGFPITKP